MDPAQAQQQAQHIILAMIPFFLLFGIVAVAILILPLWKIATKAGLAGPLALLAIIPGVGMLLALYIIAFSEWKVVPVAALYPPPYPPAYPPPPQTAYVPPAEPPTGL